MHQVFFNFVHLKEGSYIYFINSKTLFVKNSILKS